MKRRDLQELAVVRLQEAEALLSAGFPDGAYYLAGYTVECALKACIAKKTERHEFPEKKRVDAAYTHNLGALTIAAGLQNILDDDIKQKPDFGRNWILVREWNEQKRYHRHTRFEAEAIINAVGNRKNGVLRWVKQFW